MLILAALLIEEVETVDIVPFVELTVVCLSVSIMVHHRAGWRAVQGVALWLFLIWQHVRIQFVDIALTQTLSVILPFWVITSIIIFMYFFFLCMNIVIFQSCTLL